MTFTGLLLCAAYLGYRLLRSLLRLIVAWRRRRTYETRRQRRPAIVLGVAVLLCMFALPEQFSLWVHRPLLVRYARHVHSEIPLLEAKRLTGPRMIGLLYVQQLRITPSAVRLRVGPRGFVTLIDREEDDTYGMDVFEPSVRGSPINLLRPSRWGWSGW